MTASMVECTPRWGEYQDPNTGMIYCCACGQPKLVSRTVLGKTYYPRVMCQCETAADRARMVEEQEKERVFASQRSMTNSLQSDILHNACFASDIGYNARKIALAKDYVANWDDNFETARGLLFFGDTGTGKSFLAGCIGNALLDNHVSVLMLDGGSIDRRIGEYGYIAQNSVINSINEADLLIIDDFGAGLSNNYAVRLMHTIVNDRYNSGRPLIVTTNLTPGEMRAETDINLSRIYSRVLERCVPVIVNDTNIREINYQENRESAKAHTMNMGY